MKKLLLYIVGIVCLILNTILFFIPYVFISKEEEDRQNKNIRDSVEEGKRVGWIVERHHPDFGKYYYYLPKEQRQYVVFGFILEDNLDTLFKCSSGAFSLFSTGEVFISHSLPIEYYDCVLAHEFGHSKYHKGKSGTKTFGQLSWREIQADFNSYTYNPVNAGKLEHMLATAFSNKPYGPVFLVGVNGPRWIVLLLAKAYYRIVKGI